MLSAANVSQGGVCEREAHQDRPARGETPAPHDCIKPPAAGFEPRSAGAWAVLTVSPIETTIKNYVSPIKTNESDSPIETTRGQGGKLRAGPESAIRARSAAGRAAPGVGASALPAGDRHGPAGRPAKRTRKAHSAAPQAPTRRCICAHGRAHAHAQARGGVEGRRALHPGA